MINLKDYDDKLLPFQISLADEDFLISETEENTLYLMDVGYNCYCDYVLMGKKGQYLYCANVWETGENETVISYSEDWATNPETIGNVTKIYIPFMISDFEANKAKYEECFEYSCSAINTLFDLYNYYIFYGMIGIRNVTGEIEGIEKIENTHICDEMTK